MMAITSGLYLYRPVRDFTTDSPFLRIFSHDPTTFATDPRVVGSVTGAAQVEHLQKIFLGNVGCKQSTI